MIDTDLIDGVGVDVVHVITGGENGRHERRSDEALHGASHGNPGGRKAGPRIISGEQDSNLVRGLPLAHEVADAGDVPRDTSHHGVPGIVLVKDRGGIERPPRLADLRCRVRPSVEDEQVFAHDEVDVGFSFHIERRGAKSGRVEPGERFAGADIVAKHVVGRRGPAKGGECAPLWAFALCEPHEILA